MGRMGIAILIAIYVQGAYAASTELLERVGWWTLMRAVDPATGEQACAARHVGGAMTLKDASLTIAGVPMNSVSSGGSLEIVFDAVHLSQPLNEAAGIIRNFGVLTLEGAALAKAMASNKLVISVDAVDASFDMRGASQALQWIKNSCPL